MNTEEPTHKEKILAQRVPFSQNKKAQEQFGKMVGSNEHGSFMIQASKDYHATEYHDYGANGIEPLLSRSLLKGLAENPEQWSAGKKFKRNKKMDMGSLLDAAMLETGALNEFEFLPENIKNFTTKAARELRDAAYEDGKTPILHSDFEILLGSLMKTGLSEDCKEMLHGATSCVSMIGKLGGTPMKGLIDIVPAVGGKYGDGLCDLKRTKMFLPEKFRRVVVQMKYHWQAAIYLDLWNNWCQVMDLPEYYRYRWYFLIVQEDYPFGVGVAELDPVLVEEGRTQYKAALIKANMCLSTGFFPNPYEEVERLTIGFPPRP